VDVNFGDTTPWIVVFDHQKWIALQLLGLRERWGIAMASEYGSIDEPTGPTEFSHGRGLMVPRSKKPEPRLYEQMLAVYRTNPADPSSTIEDGYAEMERES
jgi:hypothetical protein